LLLSKEQTSGPFWDGFVRFFLFGGKSKLIPAPFIS